MKSTPQYEKYQHIPTLLQLSPRWIVWSDADTKVPYSPFPPYHEARVNDPDTWGDYNQAISAVSAGRAKGLGFVFTQESNPPLVGIDADTPAASAYLLEKFGSYAERSIRQKGVHIICQGMLPGGKGVVDTPLGFELYATGRYFVMTGDRVLTSATEPVNEQPAIDDLLRYLGRDPQAVPETVRREGGMDHYDDSDLVRARFTAWAVKQPVAAVGDRDNAAYRAACTGRDFGLSPDVTLELLDAPGGWRETRCPTLESSLKVRVDSAYRNGQSAAGCRHPEIITKQFEKVEAATVPAGATGTVVQFPPQQRPFDGSVDYVDLITLIQKSSELLDPATQHDAMVNFLRRGIYMDSPAQRDQLVQDLSDRTVYSVTAIRQTLQSLVKTAKQQQTTAGGGQVKWIDTDDEGKPQDTYRNLAVLLHVSGIHCRYDIMRRRQEIDLGPGAVHVGGRYAQDTALAYLLSLAVRYGLPVGRKSLSSINTQLLPIASASQYHPYIEWLAQGPTRGVWDGHSRLTEFFATVQVPPGTENWRDRMLLPWLVSAHMAATHQYGNKPPRGVLVFQGKQYRGKTTWLKFITPPDCFLEGANLNPADKDSVAKTTGAMITELGELDSTIRRADVAAIKAFLSSDRDTYRSPYGVHIETYERRTVFSGTVNEQKFLQDLTGNTRFWTVPVEDFDLDTVEQWQKEGEPLRQLWLEIKYLAEVKDADWLLDRITMQELEKRNVVYTHQPVQDLLEDYFDWDIEDRRVWVEMTHSDIARSLGIKLGSGQYSAALSRALSAMLGDDAHPVARRKGGKLGRYFRVPPVRTKFTATEPYQG